MVKLAPTYMGILPYFTCFHGLVKPAPTAQELNFGDGAFDQAASQGLNPGMLVIVGRNV